MPTPDTTDSNNGISAGYNGSRAEDCIFAAFIAVAWYNSLELVVLVFTTFKVYRGRYFWSLLVASISIIPYCLGFILKLFQLTDKNILSMAIVSIGWWGMVTGQSLVLWSRLHLVLQSRKILRAVLCVIIVDAIILLIPTSVLALGTNSQNPPEPFVTGYDVMERIQLVGFGLQEALLSTLYILETVKLLKLHPDDRHQSILYQLLIINIIILLMDASVIGVQFENFYAVQVTFKPMIYSIKLKMEYAILRKLAIVATTSHAQTAMVPDFVGLSCPAA